jgi:RNA polymerase sigma-70 factor (ECF subfamily)
MWTNEVLLDEFVESLSSAASEADDKFGSGEGLRRAVIRLPARQRTAIELVKLRELSLKEAAGVSGMSLAALRVAVHRAVKSLRRILVHSSSDVR